MSETQVVETKVVTLKNTAVSRSYPFTAETIQQIKEIRILKEEEHYDEHGEAVIYPAPVVLAEAVDKLHADYFPEDHQ